MKKILLYFSLLSVLCLTVILFTGLSNYSTGQAINGYEEAKKVNNNNNRMVELTKEENAEFLEGLRYYGYIEWMNFGIQAKEFSEGIDISIHDAKVRKIKGELYPVSYQLEITNNSSEDKYFYDFYNIDIDGIPIWDKKSDYNILIKPNKSKKVLVQGWVPSKYFNNISQLEDIIQTDFINQQLVMSSKKLNIKKFFNDVKGTADINDLENDLQVLYLISKKAEVNFKKEN